MPYCVEAACMIHCGILLDKTHPVAQHIVIPTACDVLLWTNGACVCFSGLSGYMHVSFCLLSFPF